MLLNDIRLRKYDVNILYICREIPVDNRRVTWIIWTSIYKKICGYDRIKAEGHLYQEVYIQRAKDCMFWPNKTWTTLLHIQHAECLTQKIQKGTLRCPEIPESAWEKLILQLDYFGKFREIAWLVNTETETIIRSRNHILHDNIWYLI